MSEKDTEKTEESGNAPEQDHSSKSVAEASDTSLLQKALAKMPQAECSEEHLQHRAKRMARLEEAVRKLREKHAGKP